MGHSNSKEGTTYEGMKSSSQLKTNGGTSTTSGTRNATWMTHISKENSPLEPLTNHYPPMSTTSGKENNTPNHTRRRHQDNQSSRQYIATHPSHYRLLSLNLKHPYQKETSLYQ